MACADCIPRACKDSQQLVSQPLRSPSAVLRGTPGVRGCPRLSVPPPGVGPGTRSSRLLRSARAAWREPRTERGARPLGTSAGAERATTEPSRARGRGVGRRMFESWSRLFSAPQRRTRRLSDSLWSWSACALDVQWDGRHARRNDVQKKRIGRHPGGQMRGRGLGRAIGWMDRVGG